MSMLRRAASALYPFQARPNSPLLEPRRAGSVRSPAPAMQRIFRPAVDVDAHARACRRASRPPTPVAVRAPRRLDAARPRHAARGRALPGRGRAADGAAGLHRPADRGAVGASGQHGAARVPAQQRAALPGRRRWARWRSAPAPAWLVTMYRFPGQRLLNWALVLPLAMPAYVLAYAYTDFLQVTGPAPDHAARGSPAGAGATTGSPTCARWAARCSC